MKRYSAYYKNDFGEKYPAFIEEDADGEFVLFEDGSLASPAYIKKLEDFMIVVSKEVKCLPSFADPSPTGDNKHIIDAIRKLKEAAQGSVQNCSGEAPRTTKVCSH